MNDHPHAKVAADCWRLIRALGDTDWPREAHTAAERLIEMACDSAVEAAHQPRRLGCADYRPDHNGECLNCDEPASEH
jgi:hypothetical protein